MKRVSALFLAAALVGGASHAVAQMNAEQMAMVRHANPMPNLMLVVEKHQDALGLDERQKKALADWREKMRPRMMEKVKQVVRLEKEIERAALSGASDRTIRELMARLFQVRGAIIRQKLACRDNMARILGPEKMRKVVELYRKQQEARAAGA